FFRDDTELSDCNFIWTQSYITKQVAHSYFPDKAKQVDMMSGVQRSNYSFYFLPENYHTSRTNFLILSQIWFQSTRKKKFLYGKDDGLLYEFYGNENEIETAAKTTGLFEVVEY